jgi:hypothetical protein
VIMVASFRSGDLNVANGDGVCAASDVAGEQGEGRGGIRSLNAPPHRVAAGQAGRRHRVVPQGAGEALPRRERGGALTRVMAMVKEVEGHVCSLMGPRLPNIRDGP